MLTDKQKQFLINYLPEDSMFTSKKEIEIITHHLGINTEIRDDVVKFYKDLMNSETILAKNGYCRTAKYDNYMIAMQSILAVIDCNFLINMKYKVGNRVKVKNLDWYNSNKNEYGIVIFKEHSFIEDMSDFCGTIVTIKKVIGNYYLIEEDNFGWQFSDEMFEEGICLNELYCDKTNIPTIDITPLKTQKIIWTETSPDTTELVIGENYELIIDDGTYKVIKKKPKYPTTYKECCEYISLGENGRLYTKGYKASLIQDLQKLIICRDVYWKIAGEQMGLGNPWNQDYNDRCFVIVNNNGNIRTCEYHGSDNVILAFPTKEMRDAFYENFKELIENCKELL